MTLPLTSKLLSTKVKIGVPFSLTFIIKGISLYGRFRSSHQ